MMQLTPKRSLTLASKLVDLLSNTDKFTDRGHGFKHGLTVARSPMPLACLTSASSFAPQASSGRRYFIKSSHKFLRRRHAAYGLVPSPSVVKSVPTFLNRVLAMGMDDQELIFRYFSNTMDALIASAKSTGRYEHGPINLQASGVEVARRQIVHREPGTGACKKFESQFISQTR